MGLMYSLNIKSLMPDTSRSVVPNTGETVVTFETVLFMDAAIYSSSLSGIERGNLSVKKERNINLYKLEIFNFTHKVLLLI